jgi:UDPglucose--hexose-1-phosphate uridylyltransferase
MLLDKGTGRPILMSPQRQQRPRNTGPDQDGAEDCPFCEGQEHRTTPETDAIRAAGSSPDGPGWLARAFPNLYPAARCHEVIAEGPGHTTHPGQLGPDLLGDALVLYRRRIRAVEAEPGTACAFLFKNVGAAAGSSIAHNHSQLLGLSMLPPRLASELRACEEQGCLHCREIDAAAADGREVWRGPRHVLLCPSTPKLPHEAWLLPTDHGSEFLTDGHDAALIEACAIMYRAAFRAFSAAPFNMWLHRIPAADFHWHFELQPRIGTVAALELGGDMYINAVPPESSAARWRSALL